MSFFIMQKDFAWLRKLKRHIFKVGVMCYGVKINWLPEKSKVPDLRKRQFLDVTCCPWKWT